MKRFWTKAGHRPVAGADGHEILLDGRPVRTPRRAPLVVPRAALAAAIADEWDKQGDEIDPAAMPLTGLANAAIDLATPDPVAFAGPLVAYADADLLAYREERDAALAARQAAAWDPLLHWAEDRWGIAFALAVGIVPVTQPVATRAALARTAETADAWTLAALHPLVTIGGSLVAALALVDGAVTPDEAWDAVTLDERYQEERWGVDAEAVRERAGRRAAWDAAAKFLRLSRSD